MQQLVWTVCTGAVAVLLATNSIWALAEQLYVKQPVFDWRNIWYLFAIVLPIALLRPLGPWQMRWISLALDGVAIILMLSSLLVIRPELLSPRDELEYAMRWSCFIWGVFDMPTIFLFASPKPKKGTSTPPQPSPVSPTLTMLHAANFLSLVGCAGVEIYQLTLILTCPSDCTLQLSDSPLFLLYFSITVSFICSDLSPRTWLRIVECLCSMLGLSTALAYLFQEISSVNQTATWLDISTYPHLNPNHTSVEILVGCTAANHNTHLLAVLFGMFLWTGKSLLPIVEYIATTPGDK